MKVVQKDLIGAVIRDARLRAGYESRNQFVESVPLKGKLTAEGLRKIEAGERVPRMETIETLGRKLGFSDRRIRQLQKISLESNVVRAARRAGNVDVTVHMEGKPIHVSRLPPRRKVDGFVQEVVQELSGYIDLMGGSTDDVEYFRRKAKEVLLRRLTA